MQCDAIIFDCDGTLVDSEHLMNEVLVEHAESFGIRLSAHEALQRYRGIRWPECLAHLEGLRGQALPASFATQLQERIAQAIVRRLRPMEGALDLVRSLTIPSCVASSSSRQDVELSLSVTGLLPYFAGRIFSCYEVGAWKPDPRVFLHAARSLGAVPSRCVVIEDSIAGIQAGLAAGMQVFAVHSTLSGPEVPANVRTVSGLRELITLFGGRQFDG